MKRLFYILLSTLLLTGCSLGTVSNNKIQSEEAIRTEYAELQENINDLISVEDDKVIYDYEKIKELVYDFDLLSANAHFSGEWTHETLLESMIENIDDITNHKDGE